MFTLGSHMIANNRGDPLKAYGEGSIHGMHAADQANAHNLTAKEKYLNLLGKINESRTTQQKYFSQYHLHKMAHEENVRAHHANLAETRRHHDLMHPQTQENAALGNPHLPSFASKEAEKAFYKREVKLKEKFDEDIENVQKDIQTVNKMESLISKGIGDTGPVMGMVPEAMLRLSYGPETIANRRLFEKEFTKNVLDIMNRAKGPQTDSDREYMARTTVSLKDDPVTINNYIRDLKKVTDRSAESIKYIEQEMEKGVPIDQAQKQWRRYVDANPLFGKEEGNSPTKTASEDGGMIQIITPDGIKGKIPKENVQEAINQGAKIL
jgi:DNA-binding transcriptional MerR regulator